MIRVIAIGKKHESWVSEGIARYEKRLTKPHDVSWALLPHSAKQDDAARIEESTRILERIEPQQYVMLLDETGEQFSSPALSRYLESGFQRSPTLTIVIGGAYGVDARLKSRADTIWSLSRLVFPHQLVRLMLIEQLYRAQSVQAGHPYHHA